MRRRVDSDLAELERLHPTLALQMRVSRMLGYGFALSLAFVGGVGSLMALFIGLRARRLIRQGGGRVVGIRMAWWCIIAGAVGALAAPAFIAWLFIRAVSK
jgi:hypothetical protein